MSIFESFERAKRTIDAAREEERKAAEQERAAAEAAERVAREAAERRRS